MSDTINFPATIETLTRLVAVSNWLGYFPVNEDLPEAGLVDFQNDVAEAMLATLEELIAQFPEDQRFERFEQANPVEIAGGRIGTAMSILRSLLNGSYGSYHQVGSELWTAAANLTHASISDADERNEAINTLSTINLYVAHTAMCQFGEWRGLVDSLDQNGSSDKMMHEAVNIWWTSGFFEGYQLRVWNAMNGDFR